MTSKEWTIVHGAATGVQAIFWTVRNSFVFLSAAITGAQQGVPLTTSPADSPVSMRQSGHIMEPTGFGIGHVSRTTGSPTLKTRKRDANRIRIM